MRILVVEDNPVSATYMRTVLEQRGWNVEIALDGERALQLIEQQRFDAVLVDWILPRYDGIDILHAIRQQHGNPPPYVAIVTVVDSVDVQRYCFECGANGYFVKPIQPEAIVEHIEEYYRQFER
jgi:DNA-binding response OmpR family regulator